jgi:hypothetical protein
MYYSGSKLITSTGFGRELLLYGTDMEGAQEVYRSGRTGEGGAVKSSLTVDQRRNSLNAFQSMPASPPKRESRSQSGIVADSLRRQHSDVARNLARWIVIILGGTIVLQYGTVLILALWKRDDAIKIVENMFHSWLPVISGLAGAAATHYFTERGGKRE